ncbi:putative membrane-bound dehydrogenase-like protein [Roseimicrobium gellanilyticum]|uniref:Putative membrane-bound dehydrogenase-like protein n=1 Tax=Roseimicrobium gellanilyticum TaxID=748857 RepID=A0A366HM65_9BACT|nr:PVC-type heme-binding CxxCH protein [Roseimicrobium gellanilyticum]RBP44242.1 putative membrane-bound dehydrogenase-like protein [Roseimicrobium gellanilyticum]
MKRLLVLLHFCALVSFTQAADGPIRVLYVDPYAIEQSTPGPLHEAMEALGREAIWFDYVNDDKQCKTDLLKHYDVVCERRKSDAPSKLNANGILATINGRVLRAIPVEDLNTAQEIREKVFAALLPERKVAWEAFLKIREPEKREANPNVANYEKRPEAITYQFPMSVKASMQRTQVPADMELQLFASEPDIAKPIAMAWDQRGRCWIAETRDYPHGYADNGEGHDTIKICEDTDGDGRADKFTVFADKLNLPTSLVFANGGLIITQPPRLIFLKDTNGDDKADVRKVLMDAWGVRDTHAQASSLHYGIDDWIYGCVGYSGFKGTVGGKDMEFAMGTYRFRPDGSSIEFLHQFTNNAWAHSANEAGDQFGGTANGAPIFYGGIPNSVFPQGMRPVTARKINVVDKCHAITTNYRQVDVFGGYTSAAGSAFIESDRMPERFRGKAMVCEPTMKVIALMDVQPQGAGYVAKDYMNLVASTDEWMSPVFAEVGPDGAVWFADWQNFIIQHNPTPSPERGGYKAETGPGGAHLNDLRDHARGRIYRVVTKGTNPKPAQPSLDGATQWSRLAAQQFTKFSTPVVRGTRGEGNTPIRPEDIDGLLTEVTKSVEALKARVTANDGKLSALHALWILSREDALDEATHKVALLAKDARLRRNAVRALGDDSKSLALFFGTGVVSDPDPHTRLAAFVKLATFPTTPEIKTLVSRISSDATLKQDEWLADALRILTKKHGANAWKEGPNLLPNPGFEELAENGLPKGWMRRDYGRRPGNEKAEWKGTSAPDRAHGGQKFVRIITRDDADTSLYADVPLKPNTRYRLSAWVRAHALKGKVSLNDHIGRAETEKLTAKESDWVEVETIFDSKERTKASINLLHVAKGDGYFDDVKLCELLPVQDAEEKVLAGSAKRGEDIFWKHPVAACMNCHVLGGKGSPVGPALDGIASRKDEAYLWKSLIEPNAVLAEGYTATPVSPMPPMNLILKPQELEDIKAFILSLK